MTSAKTKKRTFTLEEIQAALDADLDADNNSAKQELLKRLGATPLPDTAGNWAKHSYGTLRLNTVRTWK
ncbi:MAG: hypothetical protein RLY40_19 [Pseudomonadota bacterium]|jgi:hypothetical protein